MIFCIYAAMFHRRKIKIEKFSRKTLTNFYLNWSVFPCQTFALYGLHYMAVSITLLFIVIFSAKLLLYNKIYN